MQLVKMKCGHYSYYVGESLDHQLAASIARDVCHEHVEGIIVVGETPSADVEVTYFRSCGLSTVLPTEGLLAVGRYCHEYKMVDKTLFAIKTSEGVRHVSVHPDMDYQLEVDVPTVSFGVQAMNLDIIEDECIDVAFDLNGHQIPLTAVKSERIEFYTGHEALHLMSMREMVMAMDYHPMIHQFSSLSTVKMHDDYIELLTMTSKDRIERTSVSAAVGVVGLLTRGKRDADSYSVRMGSFDLAVHKTKHGRYIVGCPVKNLGSKDWSN